MHSINSFASYFVCSFIIFMLLYAFLYTYRFVFTNNLWSFLVITYYQRLHSFTASFVAPALVNKSEVSLRASLLGYSCGVLTLHPWASNFSIQSTWDAGLIFMHCCIILSYLSYILEPHVVSYTEQNYLSMSDDNSWHSQDHIGLFRTMVQVLNFADFRLFRRCSAAAYYILDSIISHS